MRNEEWRLRRRRFSARCERPWTERSQYSSSLRHETLRWRQCPTYLTTSGSVVEEERASGRRSRNDTLASFIYVLHVVQARGRRSRYSKIRRTARRAATTAPSGTARMVPAP